MGQAAGGSNVPAGLLPDVGRVPPRSMQRNSCRAPKALLCWPPSLQVPDYVFLEDGKVLIGTNQAW